MYEDRTPDEKPDPRQELFEEALKPRGPVDKLSHLMADRELRYQKAYVEEPGLLRRMFRSDVLWLLGSLVLILGKAFIPESWVTLDLLAAAMIGWVVGRAGLKKMRSAQAYRNGWLDGRTAMYHSLDEAADRQMDHWEWRRAESERDFDVISRM